MLLLAGCGPKVTLAVNEADPPVFHLRELGGRPCLRALGVHRLAGGQLAWRIGQRDPAACAARVSYGVLPAGYGQIGPARALVPGARYRVTITGAGFNEAAEFTAAAGVTPPF
ncbi:MAG: hypothetical protein DI610_09900 [Staphylococcus hominis]|nr:MAG: hypothetical protein DI610_09900 [Staphylococcus hominis]